MANLRKREDGDTRIGCLAVAPATEVETIDPLQGGGWDQLVSAFPDASCFHTSAWAKVLNQTYGHRPFYLRFHRSGQTTALLPIMEVQSHVTGKRGSCLPFSDSCPVLFAGDVDTKPIIEAVTGLARERGWKSCEIRGGTHLVSEVASGVSYYRHSINLLDGVDAVARRFSCSVRCAIRKAEKRGVTTEIASSEGAIRDYYHLHTRTRQRHGTPPQPLSFFLSIQQEILSSGHGIVILAHSDNRLVAGGVFFRSGRNAIYKFSASDERLQDIRANNLVMWEAIRFFAGAGCALLDFGRTSLRNHGLRRFKLGWASSEEQLNYYAWKPKLEKWVMCTERSQGIAAMICRKLPTVVNRVIGRIVYPHID